jgi:hypothetical protein
MTNLQREFMIQFAKEMGKLNNEPLQNWANELVELLPAGCSSMLTLVSRFESDIFMILAFAKAYHAALSSVSKQEEEILYGKSSVGLQ